MGTSGTVELREGAGGGIYLHCDSPQVFVQDEKGDGIFYCSTAWFETSYTAAAQIFPFHRFTPGGLMQK